jgi:hypothetical protein
MPTFRDNLNFEDVTPIGCVETSVTNYQSTPLKIPEEQKVAQFVQKSSTQKISTVFSKDSSIT